MKARRRMVPERKEFSSFGADGRFPRGAGESRQAKSRLHSASEIDMVSRVSGRRKAQHRSGCPLSISLEILGDRWSLLVVRDLMVRGFRNFRDFRGAGEGIATNVLAERLRRLKRAGIVETEPDARDGRKVNYRLTEKGIDLAPLLFDLLVWGAKHEKTGAPRDAVLRMDDNRDAMLDETRRRWSERDRTPLLPWLGGPATARGSAAVKRVPVRKVGGLQVRDSGKRSDT